MDTCQSSPYDVIANTSISIKVRTNYIASPSPTLEINQTMDLMASKGVEIYRLGFGGSPLPPCKELVDAYREHLWLTSYPPIQGLPECRESIAQFYRNHFSLDFDPEGIFIFPGSKEAIFQILSILEGPLLLPAPSWVSYAPQAGMVGKKVHWIQTRQEDDYKLSPASLMAAGKQNGEGQKILILNSPNNPAGHVYTGEELAGLAKVCKDQNIMLLFDAIYAHPLDFDGNAFKSIYEYYPEGCFFSGGLSKIFSCGGWRFGFVALPQNVSSSKLVSALTYKMSETVSGVNVPLQHAAVRAYRGDKNIQEYLAKVNKLYGYITRYMWKRLTSMGLNCPKPFGAFYLFPSFDAFSDKLLKRQIRISTELTKELKSLGIFVLPGINFGLLEDQLVIRISCTDFDGVKVLNGLENNKLDQNFINKYFSKIKGACDVLEDFLRSL